MQAEIDKPLGLQLKASKSEGGGCVVKVCCYHWLYLSERVVSCVHKVRVPVGHWDLLHPDEKMINLCVQSVGGNAAKAGENMDRC